jgi:endonuclease YncB( thermonuclease family)
MSRRRPTSPGGKRPSPSLVYPHLFRRHPVLAVVLLAGLVLAILDRGWGRFGQDEDYSRYHNRTFTVVKVVDGDTFDIDVRDGRFPTTRIRLWGVDTPEVEGSREGPMYFGAEASAFAKRMLTDRRVRIVLSPTKSRGKYGRLLAYVYLEPDGTCFNELLLETGHAYADWRFAHPRKTEFKAIEKRARSQGIGLWADVTPDRYPPWRQRMEAAVQE